VLAAPFEPTLRRRQSSAMVMTWAAAHLVSTGRFDFQRAQGMMCVKWRFARVCSPFSQHCHPARALIRRSQTPLGLGGTHIGAAL
jgi:hypothetical protein